MEEPVVKAAVIVPNEFVGPIMELCQNRRGNFIDMQYIETTRVVLNYNIPLN